MHVNVVENRNKFNLFIYNFFFNFSNTYYRKKKNFRNFAKKRIPSSIFPIL